MGTYGKWEIFSPLMLHYLLFVNSIPQPQMAFKLHHAQWMRNDICDLDMIPKPTNADDIISN
jgi:hypothetical protein